MVQWVDNLAELQEDRERHEVPFDWRAWESGQLSRARREVDACERAYRREVALLAVVTLTTLVAICWAWQSVL